MVAVPADASDITADWLRSAAPDAEELAEVTSVRAERMAEGVGMLTEIYRLTLGDGAGGPCAPATSCPSIPETAPSRWTSATARNGSTAARRAT